MRMLTLAMILDNPGEQPAQTRYRDPRELKRLGYSDLVIYTTTGLSGLKGPQTLRSADLRQLVSEQYHRVQQTVDEARRAGLGAWIFYDAPSLAAELVNGAMTCLKQKRQMLCPASDALLTASGECLEDMLRRIEGVDGIVLRLGDNDADRTVDHYLVGNDIYAPHCARCNQLGRADRLERFIKHFYELVVRKLNKKLIVRAWNVKPGGMHDNPELCKRLLDRIPVDPKLILSFKFTHTDFWRFQKWNPSSLACSDHPIIYELQCQREFEGKGAVPDYQAPLWRDGMSELDGSFGLADAVRKARVVGLWAWVRGGGWRGPYIDTEKETWIDANVSAVPQLALNPKSDPADLARRWIADRLELEPGPGADAVFNALIHSPRTALQTFYISPYARLRPDPWYPAANFIQDDQIDAEAAWTIIQRLPENVHDDVVAEKLAAEQQIASDITAIHHANGLIPKPLADTILATLQYSLTLAQVLRGLLAGQVAYRRWLKHPDPQTAQAVEDNLTLAETAWIHHTQRLPKRGCATPFGSDNLLDFARRVIEQLHAKAESAGA